MKFLYQMSPEQLQKLERAARGGFEIITAEEAALNEHEQRFRRMTRAWTELASEMSFVPGSVLPAGPSPESFYAEPMVPHEGQRLPVSQVFGPVAAQALHVLVRLIALVNFGRLTSEPPDYVGNVISSIGSELEELLLSSGAGRLATFLETLEYIQRVAVEPAFKALAEDRVESAHVRVLEGGAIEMTMNTRKKEPGLDDLRDMFGAAGAGLVEAMKAAEQEVRDASVRLEEAMHASSGNATQDAQEGAQEA